VDFILGAGEVAVEVKGTNRVENRDLRPLAAFTAEHKSRLALLVCNEPVERVVSGLRIVPWRQFLAALWAGEIIH
jgi:hypothetical protein